MLNQRKKNCGILLDIFIYLHRVSAAYQKIYVVSFVWTVREKEEFVRFVLGY